ncbi:MAG TPA: RluA family pseudouridine synthase [Candidatus Lachnoclostridium pullistercoris]|uniref:RNA pseudouridylate synthase n=1 Tax=Candidatus Lachnoclostridium pullistercoris TaxID=2838632 RepID=A0A9D2T665_9FIRM|nr:RluA family pseudouridine synthase [Candidatus Lachnoclostridium pullistercoris]
MLNILFEDQSIIVAEKPVGLESQSTRKLEPDMVSEIKKHIHKLSTNQSGKREEPYVGVIHRLDKPVGGVMVYAKTRQAAASLSRQVQNGEMEKYYMAIVCGKLVDNVGNFVDFLLKDGKTNTSRVVDKGTEGARRAELEYRAAGRGSLDGEPVSLAEIHLLTGRHHQIRVQFASRGFPLWGDEKYGNGKKRETEQAEGGYLKRRSVRRDPLALWAFRLEFTHPVTGKRMKFEKKPESGAFARFWADEEPFSGRLM